MLPVGLFDFNPEPAYNIAPTQKVAAVRAGDALPVCPPCNGRYAKSATISNPKARRRQKCPSRNKKPPWPLRAR